MENNDKRYYDSFLRFGRTDTQNIYTNPYLIREILSKILFTLNNKILVWFNVEFAFLLVKEFDINPKDIYIYTNSKEKLILQRNGFNIIYQEEINLDKIEKEYKNMEFDAVLGNPPWQKKVGENKTEPLWNKFLEKSFEFCREGGYVSLVHPSGWRDIDGKFKKIQGLLKSKKINYLSLHDEKDSQKIFGVQSCFDWYVIENIKPEVGGLTTIKCMDNSIVTEDLSSMEFIPNGFFDEINSLIADEGEEKVNLIYSRSAYGTDKYNVSKTQDNEFIYPCVSNVNKNESLTLYRVGKILNRKVIEIIFQYR
jgi:hypothetical protein